MSIKTKKVEYIDLWNNDYDVRIYFTEKETVEPEPELPEIPTGINLEFLVPSPELPLIPTNIKAIYYEQS